MAVKGEANADMLSRIPRPVLIAGVIVLIAFAGWMGYRTLGPQPDPVNELTMAQDKWMDRIAKESGGDSSKLAPEDLNKLQKQTYGHGDQALKAYAQKHGYAK